MRFWEAMKAFEEGKCIRCIEWNRYSYLSNNTHSGIEWMHFTRWEDCLRKEWELYQEPEQLLSFSEVVNGLKDGKKFIRKGWEPSCSEPYQWRNISLGDLEATDWVEVK